MSRVLSALVLIPLVLGIVCWLPPAATTWLVFVVVIVASLELGMLRAAFPLSTVAVTGVAAVAVAAVVTADAVSRGSGVWIAFAAFAAAAVSSGRATWSKSAAPSVATIYIGLPLTMLSAIRAYGPATLIWLFAVIIISDSAQYYTGRAFGRHKLAPIISPKKTIEGAIGGLIIATTAGVVLARWWLPSASVAIVALMTIVIAVAGMTGDLFESLLKRKAGVKDSSALIPGHGGVLDRIDSWLFAAPVYYVFLRWCL